MSSTQTRTTGRADGATTDQAVALSPDEEVAWRAAARLLIAVPRALETDLVAATGLGLGHYTVLVHLSEAPDHRLRIGDLAHRVGLSPARTSRVVDELGRDGLVRRTACPGDGRAVLAVLSGAGLQRLEGAWPAHAASVRARLLDHADPAETAVVAAVLTRVLAALGETGCAG